jgi:hypothetical protein
MVTSGAKLLAGIAAIALAGFLIWRYVPIPHIDDAGAILITGFLAAIIAIWALFSQRIIARRQCTLEHIAGLEADGDLIRGRLRFHELVRTDIASWAAANKEQSPEFQAITTRLNEFELISIGIQRGIIDFELYRRWYKAGTVRAWRDAEPFVKALRARLNNDAIYHEFHQMVLWFEKNERPPNRSWWWGNFF